MSVRKKIISLSLLMVAVFSVLPVAQASRSVPLLKSFVDDDDRFLALRDAAMHDDPVKAAAYATQLGEYQIPSYVDYYLLRSQIRTASTADVRNFLNRYAGSAIADRLRNDWLLVLGNRGDWENFDKLYPQFVLNDDTQLKCYALLSRATKQQNVASETKNLIVSSRSYGEGCYALVKYLDEQGQFKTGDIWTQIRLVAENGALTWAQRLGKLIDVPEKNMALAFEKPAKLLKKGPQGEHELFIVALGRVAKSDVDDAADALTRAGNQLSETEKAQAWAQIALQSALKLQPEAAGYWQKAANANLSLEAYQWRARTALRLLDWKGLKRAIEAMPQRLRDEPAWVYWQGRALKEEGKTQEAQALFASIADQAQFYGQLALEEQGQKIGVPLASKAISAEELAPLEKNPGLQRALKFYQLNLRLEGNREWNWELRQMSERQHLAVAEFARQNNLLDRMVNTSDKTRYEVDFNQRFPTPYNESMYKATQALGLDMAWVYGLIRQESRFVMDAKSHVGAAGLMQVMPATARYVAKKAGLGNLLPEQINETETNITLGTNYLNMVLTDLGGSQALASAAYNAGPGRPRAWRATLTRPVEGAIFTETIPFNETRGYVKNVLSNATYYAALLEKKPQSLKARLGVVAPKGMEASEINDLKNDLNGKDDARD